MTELTQRTSLIGFQSFGNPPDRYTVTFRCGGMIDANTIGQEHVAKIYLPAEYPREAPKVSFLTRCFHPNIVAAVQVRSVQEKINRRLQLAEDEERRRELIEEMEKDETLWEAHVCLDALDYNWSPAITLDEVCIELAEMLQYKRFNVDDPLNPEAADWARRNREQFPVDRRAVLDLELNREIVINILGPDLAQKTAERPLKITILERRNG
jgi:ubiquitin-protein ligase